MAERLCVLILIVGLCLFVAFVIWIVFFMRDQNGFSDENLEKDDEIFSVVPFIEETAQNSENFNQLEDGGEIFIITDEYDRQTILRPPKRIGNSW